MTTNKTNWYAARMGNDHQGLIVDENTGANIAVAYDKQHAPLLAAAPDLLTALQMAIVALEEAHAKDAGDYAGEIDRARSAIQRATEGRT